MFPIPVTAAGSRPPRPTVVGLGSQSAHDASPEAAGRKRLFRCSERRTLTRFGRAARGASLPILLALGAVVALSAGAAQPTKRPSDAERGEELYRRHCVACHGVRNGGDGPATAALVAPVPALVGQVKTDDPTVHVVLKGRASMPGYEATFDRPDAVRVLAYMAELGPDKELPAVPGKGDEKEKKKATVEPGEEEAVLEPPDQEG